MSRLSVLWVHISNTLFPWLTEQIGPLTQNHRDFIAACELAQLDIHMAPFRAGKMGRKKLPRIDFAKAFLAKSIFNIPDTKALIAFLKADVQLRRLCGWETGETLPSEASFCRAFAEFARQGFGDKVHAAMVTKFHGDERCVLHISRDSTAIVARERPAPKPLKSEDEATRKKDKRGRPAKGEIRPSKPKRRVELQPTRPLAQNLAELPKECDSGGKVNSQGNKHYWRGYKLHVDCADGGVPIAAVLTSASVHDSQVAIVLAQMSATRVSNRYDLMDAAYDVAEIKEYSQINGRIAIIDENPRAKKQATTMPPADAKRFKHRSTVERFNSTLKDNYGAKHLRVRGPAKVGLHLFFAVIAITAAQRLRLQT